MDTFAYWALENLLASFVQGIINGFRNIEFSLYEILYRIDNLDRGYQNDILQVIGLINSGLEEETDAAVSKILQATETMAAQSEDSLLRVESGVTGLIGEFLGDSNSGLGGALASVISGIGSANQSALGSVVSVADKLGESIGGKVGDAIQSITGIFQDTNGSIEDLLRDGTNLFEILTSKAIGAIEETLGVSLGSVSDSLGKISDVITDQTTLTQESQRETQGKINEALEQQIEQSKRNSEDISQSVTAAIEAITVESESALATTREALETTGAEQVEATTESGRVVSEAIQREGEIIAESWNSKFGTADAPTPDEVRQRVNSSVSEIAALLECPERPEQLIHQFIDAITKDWAPLTAFSHALGEIEFYKEISAPILQVFANCYAQAAAKLVPTALPSPPEIIDQVNRRIISSDQGIEMLMRQGFSFDRANDILATRRSIPEIGYIQTWWLRGLITTEYATGLLIEHGLAPSDIENMLAMSFFIPPAQDLITMAVREVFTPETVERFGQNEDFPQDFADFARLQGISEDWARKYWAAHWALPSPNQGFEMFQREVISRDDLNMLLKALDIMPFWRDAMTKIAYRSLTRVDVRRMHALGVMDRAEVKRRYQHMGFSPDDAELMTQFTEEYNSPRDNTPADELEGLTRGMVLNLLERGAITRDQAAGLLREQGIGEAAINIMLQDVALRIEIEQRDAETDLILERAKAGVISIDDAQDQLGGLGLESAELTRAMAKLERVEASATKLPSRTDLDKMLLHGIVTEIEYVLVLRRLGYSDIWAVRYLQLHNATSQEPN